MKKLAWRWMNEDLHKLSETEVMRLLHMEVDGAKREHIVVRLHARYCRLRADRERAELLKGLKRYG